MGWKQSAEFAQLLDKAASSLSKNKLESLVHLALSDATHGYKDVCAQLEKRMKHSPAAGKARLNVLYVMSAIMRRSKKQEKAKDKYCPRLLPRLESIAGHLSELPSPYWAAVAKIVRVWRADRLLPEEALAHFAGFSSQPADSSGQPSPSGSAGQDVPPERNAAPAAEPSNGLPPAAPQLPAGLAAAPQPWQPPPPPLQTAAAESGRKRRSRWEDGETAAEPAAFGAPETAPPLPPPQPPPLPDQAQVPAMQPPPWAAAPQQQAAAPAFSQPPPWQWPQQAQAQAQQPAPSPWQHAARTGNLPNSTPPAPAAPPPRPPTLPRPISLPPPQSLLPSRQLPTAPHAALTAQSPAQPPAPRRPEPLPPPPPPPLAKLQEQQRAGEAELAALRGEAAALTAGLTSAALAQLHGAAPASGPEQPPPRKRSRWENAPAAVRAEQPAADSAPGEPVVKQQPKDGLEQPAQAAEQAAEKAAEPQPGQNGGTGAPAAAAADKLAAGEQPAAAAAEQPAAAEKLATAAEGRLAAVPEEQQLVGTPKGEPDWSTMELPGLLDSL